jgi:hypothetical protein
VDEAKQASGVGMMFDFHYFGLRSGSRLDKSPHVESSPLMSLPRPHS